MARGAFRSLAVALFLGAFSTILASTVVVLPPGPIVTEGSIPPCPEPPATCPRTWNYAHQDLWGTSCAAWSTCSGSAQSPINVVTPVNFNCNDVEGASFTIPQPFIDTYLFNTGNYFRGNPQYTQPGAYGNATVTYLGNTYVFDHFSFHSPSEHLLNNQRYDLEFQMHFKRQLCPSGSNPLMAVSVFFERSAGISITNQFLESIIYDLPQFSDCSCGNGRVENAAPWQSYTQVWGVNEQCDLGSRNSNTSMPEGDPNCCRLNCMLPVCGDGVVDQNEECDNGAQNANTSNHCRLNCCLPTCGDHILDAGEECDDGNRFNLDGCSSICLFECGDGQLNLALEQCDNGARDNDTAPDACRTDCKNYTCGDYTTDTNEQCDGTYVPGVPYPLTANGVFAGKWPNGANPSQCRASNLALNFTSCTDPRCGDGITDLNEQCDDGAKNGPGNYCNSSCFLQCGDHVVQTGEECDDGNGNSWAPDAPCRPTCTTRKCGDGIVDSIHGEQCDSVYIDQFNVTIGNWWCSSTCQQLCGSGLCPNNEMASVNSTGKQCDQGCYNSNSPNRCRINCMMPICGDGILDTCNEECDNGGANSNSVPNACRLNCHLPRCGDGTVDKGESCDDNNNLPGDGCDPNCRWECGNGALDYLTGELCDWGAENANVADTCRTNCQLPVCGDGITDSLEECDAGTLNTLTVPNMCRLNCRLPYCGDGIIDYLYGEKCDNGARNDDGDVYGCSTFCTPNYCRQRAMRQPLNLNLAIPSNLTTFVYSGSLTRPPCTEDVQWLIFATVQPMSTFQYSEFTNAQYGLPNSFRTLQSTNGRHIVRPCQPPPPVCGNGIQEAGEQCDLGYLINSDWQANRCRDNCMNPSCGDGVTDSNEECDNGGASATCTSTCKLIPLLVNPYAYLPWTCASTCKWSMLNPSWSLCAGDRTNAAQSPINIVTSTVSGLNPTFGLPAVSYTTSSINFINSGRQLVLIPNGTQTFAGGNLLRIEFQSPSGHTINGQHAALEAQFIHQLSDGTYVALSLLYNVGASSSFLSQFDFYVPPYSDCAFNNGIVDPGEVCDDGAMDSNSRPGTCRRNGMLPWCGDGVVDRGEQCDWGVNPVTGYFDKNCRESCLLPYCGDGIVDPGEQCDFNNNTGPPCDLTCHTLCGNGLLNPGEECDNGTLNSWLPNACRPNCQLPECGDDVVDSGEWCDGPRTVFCNPTTCSFPYCGDGVVDCLNGEQCDEGTALNGLPNVTCTANCLNTCGDGVVLPLAGEQCDNGPLNSNTNGACRTTCLNPICGDHIIDYANGETCDPPAVGYCSPTCQLTCGNGVIDAGELCDWGTLNDDTLPNYCRTNCQPHHCNDGVRDAGEECDFGAANGNAAASPCRSSCVLAKCGDGVVDTQEQCDDNNLNNGDGCSNTCLLECGNGRRDGNEACDNGAANANTADACRPTCVLPFCGDGIIDSGEQCDNGLNNGNGANQCRPTCTLPVCGDDIVDNLYGERCDTGSSNSDYSGTCSTTCIPNNCRSCSAGLYRVADLSLALEAFSNSPFVTYHGSLNVPPCTESVTWYVSAVPATYSARQNGIFNHGGCPRGVQPLNGRAVAYTNPTGAICGNCKLEAGEQCDTGDNNANAPNKCKLNCVKPHCGDGYLDAGEQCDLGSGNSAGGPCNLQCQWVTTCPAICTASLPPCFSGGATCPASCPNTSVPTCSSTLNNAGTYINVNFARLLQGAGCTGPNCASN